MKKQLSILVILVLVVSAIFCNGSFVWAASSSSLSISSPDNWECYSWDDSLKIKWNTVKGASGYYVTIKNNTTDEYYLKNKYTTGTSLSATKYIPDTLCTLKIWVGAVDRKSSSPEAAFASDINYVYIAHEPEIVNGISSSVTDTSAVLSMDIIRNCGYPITNYGFYLGTKPTEKDMVKYSGGSCGAAKGEKTVKITDLTPDTTYYYCAYAENLVGESTSEILCFKTKTSGTYHQPQTDEFQYPASLEDAKDMLILSTKVSSCQSGKIRYIAQVTCDKYYNREYYRYTIGESTGYLRSGNKCTRAALSMCFSYLGVDVTPGRMSEIMGTVEIASPVRDVPGKIDSVDRVSDDDFETLWENYCTDTDFSPILVYFDYKNSHHAIVVYGFDGEYYLAADSAANNSHIIRVAFNDTFSKIIASPDYSKYTYGNTVTAVCQWYNK